MPRRKLTSGEGGRRAKVCRVEHSDEPLVISDSDHEEEEDCVVSRSSRAVRCKRRGNRSHLQEMTEEEMLDLAMKLSAQEANSAAQRQQLEYKNMQKAIAESLAGDKDSSFEASECQFEAASSSAQPQQSVANVTSHLRRKLSYPSQSQTHSGRESPAAHVTERETTSPLPEMPDLSQTTSSHLSSSSSAQVCEPPAASQHVHESSQAKTADKQPIIKDSEEDELFRSVSQTKCSPILPRGGSFIRQPLVYVEKLSQDLIRASTDSKDHLHLQNNAVGPTCASISQSQQDSNLPMSHVFTQNDFKETTDLLEDKNDGSTSDGKESNTQIPDEDLPTCLSHKGLSPENTDADKCSSPSRTLQPSSPRCAPENGNADVTTRDKTPDLKQVKDQITQVENSTADSERAPNTRSWDGFTSHMILHLTDDDDEDDSSEEVRSPSPVFHDETAWPRISPTQPCISSVAVTPNPFKQDTQVSQHALQDDSRTSKGLKSKSSDLKPLEKGECTVSYYWGVPFCPLGQNPDDYTRVIMCQLEVYEKSLKEARRELLRKAEWSQPVFPGSSERTFGTRRLKRYRAPQLSEDEEQKEEEGEKENKRIEVEEEREEAREESAGGSEEPAQGGQSETYLVLSSPETKAEEEQETTFFLSQEEPKAETAPSRNGPWDTTRNTQIEPADEEEEAQNHEHFEEEEMICPETQMTENSTPELMLTSPASPAQPQSRADSEVMEVDEEGGAPAVEEEVMEQESVSAETAPPHNQRMECPMCLKFFPFSKIEIHAAFCDGEAEDQIQQEEQSQVVRRTRTRRDQTEETRHRSEKSAQMEKCSLCQGLFPLQDYPAHFHLCRKKTDPKTNQDNGPISAVQQTEQRQTGSDEAGPSDISTRKIRGPSDPAVKGTGGGSVDCSVTTSSFNAFSPVSDDTERLTDLQQQDSSRNSQRLARKRKFKK